jgi:hypothetical protein
LGRRAGPVCIILFLALAWLSPVPALADGCFVFKWNQAIDRAVTWLDGADVGKLAGKVIQLRFKMADADLCSLRFF